MNRLTFLMLAILCASYSAGSQNKDNNDRTSVLKDIVVQPGGTTGDVVCFGCGALVRGKVAGDIVVFGASANVEDSTSGDVVAIGGNIRFGPGVHTDGDAVAVGGYVTQAQGTQVGGDIVPVPYVFIPGQRHPPLLGAAIVAGVHLLLVLLCALILKPQRTENVAQTLRQRKGWVALAGVGGWVAAIAIYFGCGVLGDTSLSGWIAGIAVGLVTMALSLILLVGLTGLSAFLGVYLAPRHGYLGRIVAGSALFLGLELIPVLGFAAFCVLALTSMGCALASRLGRCTMALGTFPARESAPVKS